MKRGMTFFRATRGMTLLETLLAMIILSGGIILLANSWGGSFLRLRKTQLTTEVAALLERKMIEVDLKYRGKPLESIEEETSDDFGSDYPQYRWEMKSKELELPDIAAAMSAQEGGAKQELQMIIKTLTEHLKKTVKEVKVTVYFKPAAGEELAYSATTYFVDYNKQIPIPGMGGAPPGG